MDTGYAANVEERSNLLKGSKRLVSVGNGIGRNMSFSRLKIGRNFRDMYEFMYLHRYILCELVCLCILFYVYK